MHFCRCRAVNINDEVQWQYQNGFDVSSHHKAVKEVSKIVTTHCIHLEVFTALALLNQILLDVIPCMTIT